MRLRAFPSLAIVTLPMMSVLGCQMNSLSSADIKPDTAASISLSPGSVIFSSTPIGTTATQLLTLNNTGDEALPLSGTGLGISISGANASSFAQTNQCGTSVAAGAGCAITLTFNPTAAEALNATLNIASSASASPQMVALSGTGTDPAISISSPASLTFPITPVGVAAAAQSITLNNTGDGVLNLSGTGMGISVTGADASSFTQTNECGTSVAAGTSCTITIVFAPTVSGALNATLNIAGNAGRFSQLVPAIGAGIDLPSGPSAGAGTVYYVDNTVPDVHVASATPDCTSYNPTAFVCGEGSGIAYATIADLNARKFSPGDQIFFRRGEIWREQLTDKGGGFGYSGSVGAPITFGAFGSSTLPLPIISGSNLIDKWAPEQVSSSNVTATVYSAPYITNILPKAPQVYIWTGAYADTPNQVFEDGKRLTQNTSGSGVLAVGQWYLDTANSLIWIRTKEDDNPGGHTIEASQRDYAITINQNSNLRFYNLQVENANVHGFNSIGLVGESANMVIYGMVSQNNYQDGIAMCYSENDMIVSSTAEYNGQDGIGGYQVPNYLVIGNTVHDNGQLFLPTFYPLAGIHVDGPESTNMIIEYNLIYNNGVAGLADHTSGIDLDTVGSGVVIRYNEIYSNTKDGIEIDASNAVAAYGNVIFNNESIGIYAFADFQPDLTGTQLFNNTLYGNTGAGILLRGSGKPNGCMNNLVINNIVVNTKSGPNLAPITGCDNPGANGSGNVYSFNDLGMESTNFVAWGTNPKNNAYMLYATYEAWETAVGNCGTAGCSHSVQADPIFTNTSTNNFTLTADSPARGPGLNIGQPYNFGIVPFSTWPSNVVLSDWTNSPGGWGIGAFSY